MIFQQEKQHKIFLMRETNEELKGVTVPKASAIILKEWKKVQASDKKMKK